MSMGCLKMKHMVLLLLAALAVVQPKVVVGVPPIFPTWNIHVVNGLSNGDLFVHCKSKDDDLGEHDLAGHGTEFQWTFKVNFFGTTLYWCYLRKLNAQVSFEAFWVEKANPWLKYMCEGGVCIWTAKDDGIYLRNTPDQFDQLIHKWGS